MPKKWEIKMKISELLSSPSKWTQGSFAKDADGEPVCWSSRYAERFCLLGALKKCYPNVEEQNRIRSLVRDRVGVITNYNDSTDYQTVISLVKELDI